jgi:hypothetical protein
MLCQGAHGYEGTNSHLLNMLPLLSLIAEVLTRTRPLVFCDVTLYSLLDGYQHLGRTCIYLRLFCLTWEGQIHPRGPLISIGLHRDIPRRQSSLFCQDETSKTLQPNLCCNRGCLLTDICVCECIIRKSTRMICGLRREYTTV